MATKHKGNGGNLHLCVASYAVAHSRSCLQVSTVLRHGLWRAYNTSDNRAHAGCSSSGSALRRRSSSQPQSRASATSRSCRCFLWYVPRPRCCQLTTASARPRHPIPEPKRSPLVLALTTVPPSHVSSVQTNPCQPPALLTYVRIATPCPVPLRIRLAAGARRHLPPAAPAGPSTGAAATSGAGYGGGAAAGAAAGAGGLVGAAAGEHAASRRGQLIATAIPGGQIGPGRTVFADPLLFNRYCRVSLVLQSTASFI